MYRTQKILGTFQSSHPYDRSMGNAQLQLLQENDQIALGISTHVETAILPLNAKQEAMVQAILMDMLREMNPVRRTGQDIDGSVPVGDVVLRMVRSNRGDPFIDGVDFYFLQPEAGKEDWECEKSDTAFVERGDIQDLLDTWKKKD